ncbi:Lrp/AsnC ligand binding domain-containing protein [Nitrosopumilus sp. K4]|uniref:Lrp/AsnC ligand binding domain-containing protein n=1 Tax=Nitrosopumilus sp. K4 TaxID=2795383 RepID=UPI001BAA83B7|nr:Lrp/AsnC ligand binding domain-containing protein [Nitrosopumilus sp. K4]QUC64125.1 Lrp/AsnC ligand binding domain-containing protein [Nitrosopumilus sp. K4]
MAKAYVMMCCDVGSESEVISSLKKIKGIRDAHGTLGLYDIVAQIESPSEEEIQKTVTGVIRKMPKIHTTMTLTRSESGELFEASEKFIGSMLGQNSAKAYVVMYCEKGQEYSTLKNLSHIPEVKEADVVFGYYDVICKVETQDEKTLDHVITKAIRTLPNIRTSMTLNVIQEQEKHLVNDTAKTT